MIMWTRTTGTDAPLELLTLFEEVVNGRQLVRLREPLVYINSYIDDRGKFRRVWVSFYSLRSARLEGMRIGGGVIVGGGGRQTAGGSLRSTATSRNGMWRMCGACGVLEEFDVVAVPLLVESFVEEHVLDGGELARYVVVEALGDSLNGDVDRGAEPMSTIRKGERRLGAKGLILRMGEWMYGNEHVR